MVKHHVFLWSDVFSWSLAGTGWINFEWAAEISAYLLTTIAGLSGLIVAKALMGLVSLTLLFRLLKRNKAGGLVLFVLMWLGYHVLQVRLCTRIELFSFIFFPALLLLVHTARENLQQKWLPFLTFATFILWANTHAGFAYGLVLIGCFSIGTRWSHDSPIGIKTIDRMFIGALLGSLVNPWGFHLFAIFLQHASDFKNGVDVLAEWGAPTFADAPAFWTTFVLGSVAVVTILMKRQRTLYAWIPAFVVFAVFGARYLRTTSYLAFIALPLVGLWMSQYTLKTAMTTILTVIVGGLLWFEKPFFRWPVSFPIVDARSIPQGGLEFLDQHKINGRLFNSYGFGGFVEWKDPHTRPVFMDGRYIFFPLVSAYQDIMLGKQKEISADNWAHYFNDLGVDYVLTKYEPLRLHRAWDLPVKHESAMNIMFPQTDWALVYWDDACLVFLKRHAAFENVIAQYEYKTLKPYDAPAMINLVAAKPQLRPAIEQELTRHDQEFGPSWYTRQVNAFLHQSR